MLVEYNCRIFHIESERKVAEGELHLKYFYG